MSFSPQLTPTMTQCDADPCWTKFNWHIVTGTPTPMPLHLTPLDNNFDFEVQGLDIWSGLDDAQVRTPDDAWANQGVLVFRRQALTEGELDECG